MKKIILTGGGTAGHVTPNIALLPSLIKQNFDIYYIGTKNGIEKNLIEKENIKYYDIPAGKLRRYISKENIIDIFKVIKGIKESYFIIKKIKPDIVFSKGGFVALPVVIGAKLNNIPIIIHESDITPGLANKIAIPFAKIVCTTFPETLKYIPKNKGINTGTPIRKLLFDGDKQTGIKMCKFSENKPIIMIMCGSLGSVKINTQIRSILKNLLSNFNIIHICGKNNLDNSIKLKGYKQFEYLSEELPHIMACADIIISRAGSNSISEFLALKKPNLLIPLSANASRGDQILNANSFEKQGFSMVLKEENMNPNSLEKSILELFNNRKKYISNMENKLNSNSINEIINIINKYRK